MRRRLIIVAVVLLVALASFLAVTWHVRLGNRSRRVGAAALGSSVTPDHCFRLTYSPAAFSGSFPMRSGQSLPTLLLFSPVVVNAQWHKGFVSAGDSPVVWSAARWAPVVRDSVDVIVPTLNWAVGVRIRLPASGTNVTGRAWPYLDMPSQDTLTAVVHAVLVDCNS